MRGNTVYYRGTPVDDVSSIRQAQTLKRLDRLFDVMRADRSAWVQAHVGQTFPGTALLYLDRSLEVLVVKSVFQTIVFAGYPMVGFVTRDAAEPARTGALTADAMMPTSLSMEPYLIVDVERGGASLTWTGDASTTRLALPETGPQRTDLANRIAEEWRRRGTHRTRDDRLSDHAILEVDNDLSFDLLASVLDALLEPKRPFGAEGEVPALDVMLSMTSPSDRGRDNLAKARLPPEVIQRIVRARYDALRACYDAGLARNSSLNGRVEVRFVIEADGNVSSAQTTPATTLPDEHAIHCILDAYGGLQFPAPDGHGKVTVVYPILFTP